MATPNDRSIAREISQELDGLPLAIDQAGAYMKETPCLLADYMALYQTRHRDLLRARGSFDKDYPASVATTWSLSFEKVRQANAAAAELLNFCAFLAPNAIPEEMITGGAQHLTPSLQKVAVNPLQFDQAMVALLAYSLVSRNTNATLNVHRLVQAVLRANMTDKMQHEWAARAVRAVNLAFPDVDDVTLWEQCERYLPHARVCATLIEEYSFEFTEASLLLNQTAVYLYQRAQYPQAEPLYQQALAIAEQQLGPEHPHTAGSLNNLAELYRAQGKYAEAEPLLKRALAIAEQQLGLEHPNTQTAGRNYAALLRTMGGEGKRRGWKRLEGEAETEAPPESIAENEETTPKAPSPANLYQQFRREKLHASAFGAGSGELLLLGGMGALVGVFTQSWPWAVGTVAALFLLAYALGYRKALSLLPWSVIGIVSGTLVYGITVSLASAHYDQVQTSHLWFNVVRLLTLRHQLIAGTCIGAVFSLLGFMVYYSKIGFNIAGAANSCLVLGGIAWLIVISLGSIFDWGFGFGYGWSFGLLYGFVVTVLAGVGVIGLLFVWTRARTH
jgi:tetratricopeptide (TPR) repeat protein